MKREIDVMTTKKFTQGRPRKFDIDHVLDVGEALFHEYGYDYVGISKITKLCDITPTSFYAAFKNKDAFFHDILNRYIKNNLILNDFYVPNQPLSERLSHLLNQAVHVYTHDKKRKGCLLFEALHLKKNSSALSIATQVAEQRRQDLLNFINAEHCSQADQIADFVFCTLAGLSACAREGWSSQRLENVVKNATQTLRACLQ